MDSGTLTWLLVAAAMVLFMIPGLAFFYGGMEHGRNVLNMLMMNFYCVLVVPVLWFVVAFSLAYGDNSFIGNLHFAFLNNIGIGDGGKLLMTVTFLGMFASISPALISGAVAGRMKFSAWAIFVPLWLLVVYVPVFKWVYGGWLAARGSLDFAGGTAIHVNAGTAALVAAVVLGRRRGWPGRTRPPHSMPLAMIGTGILWFGWFGFNAGSAMAVNGQTVQAFLNTFLAAAAGGLGWLINEWLRDGHATNLGAASGIVAGLVAITPAAGFVSGPAPIIIGAIAGVVCAYAVHVKYRFGYDDSLDVVGVHFVGGLVGSLLVGFFANPAFFKGDFMAGLLYGGGPRLLFEQLLANAVAIAWSLPLTLGILLVIRRFVGLRVSDQDEIDGMDLVQHAEEAYHSSML